MQTVLIVIHLMVVICLIAVILLQRSEGGALGVGGGGGNSILAGRGAVNAMTRTTAILATIFFLTSITLATLTQRTATSVSILDDVLEKRKGEEEGRGVLPLLQPRGSSALDSSPSAVPSSDSSPSAVPASDSSSSAVPSPDSSLSDSPSSAVPAPVSE